ncbi:YceI family protein [Planctobacterium marinum]|uniref:YceI family protein n=1 Tax=Planctobacterium marinum TaxID=1631968 RepID=UPI001E319028|nr:YceI family protein [Planctobacterium marinum]MCC2604955.1 YceI family protein [Planctobacterium marinum]
MKKTLAAVLLTALLSPLAQAADYVIDSKGAHASINFKTQHLGYSWLTGRFNEFEGTFSYDAEKPQAAKIAVNIKTASIDSNHAERDKHLRSDDFLNVKDFPEAKFVSTKITDKGDGKLEVAGKFTLHGTTKNIVIDAEKIGEGDDPWGGYRAGFAGNTEIRMADYGMKEILGPTTVLLELHVEGVRQ